MYKRCRAKKTLSESTAFRLSLSRLSFTFWIGKVDGLIASVPVTTKYKPDGQNPSRHELIQYYGKITCIFFGEQNNQQDWKILPVTILINSLGRRLGGKCWKILNMGHCFASIFDISRENDGQAFSAKFQALLLWGYTIAIFTAHAPGQHIWQRPDSNFKCFKTKEVRYSCLASRPCQH